MKTMKLFLTLALTGFMATAQTTWNVDNAHSSVRFTIAHMVISEVEGTFSTFTGSINQTTADFSKATFNLNIDVASVNTNNAKRDGHLKGVDFFEVASYPNIAFKSTSVVKKDNKKYTLKGDLTMHGVTKPISFDLVYTGTIKDPWGGTRAGFKATGTISRADFNLKYNSAMDNGGVLIGDEVTFNIKLETVQAK